MSKADDADDLYADLYGNDAEPSSNVAAEPAKNEAPAPVDPRAAAAAPAAMAAPAAAPVAAAPGGGASFIPAAPHAPAEPTAELRTAAAARGEHVAPQDLPDEGYVRVRRSAPPPARRRIRAHLRAVRCA